MEALASMSMEKNFKHWHGDIETTDNPLEAGKNIGYIFSSTMFVLYLKINQEMIWISLYFFL